jgi:methylenetetrahydrofolate reductase (NADPH)
MSVLDKIKTAKRPLFTFELLPPLKGHSIDRIYRTIDSLIEYEPAYINFTSHRNEVVLKERPDGLIEKRTVRKRPGTVALAAAVRYKYDVTVVPHVLCGGFTKEETENVLIDMHFLGINDVLALRGDPPRGSRTFVPEEDGHRYSSELVSQIADMNNGSYLDDVDNTPTSFCIGVAGYPEKHIEAANMKADLERLKQKVDAGGDYIVTQMFFDNKKYYDFLKMIREIGIDVPVIPGIKPVAALNDVNLLPQTFNIDMPEELVKELAKCKTNEDAREVGIEWTTMQSRDLLKNNVPGIHYYTLGASDNISRIVRASY